MNPESIYLEIGERIRVRRKANRLRQHELADRVGISRASLANMEVGRQKVLVHQLYAIAIALGLAPADLIPAPPALLRADDLPLPANLKPKEREQIARLLSDQPQTVPRRDKDVTNAAQKKR
nr:helix-turn-helix transcriptional regulator [Bradyrhizobium tropiciagri]